MILIRVTASIEPDLAHKLAAQIAVLFATECLIEPTLLNIDQAYDSSRSQYNTRTVLESLKQSLPGSTRALLGIVNEDIYLPGLTFVFGAAEVGGQVALISLARLKSHNIAQADQLLAQRVFKEAIHELGHVYGLEHCDNPRCIMKFAQTVEVVDRRPARFCADCAHTLAELMISGE